MLHLGWYQRHHRLDIFGFEELAYGHDEAAWFPSGKYSVAIIDSLDHAISEAKGRIAWLSVEAEQLVGPERRDRVSHQTWCGEGWVVTRRPVNSDVMRLQHSSIWRDLLALHF